GKNLIDWSLRQVGPLFDETVEVVDVGAVVVVVMDLHCLGVDVWFERLIGIAERRQGKRLRLGQGGASTQHACRTGEGGGARQEFQGISPVHVSPPWRVSASLFGTRADGTPVALHPERRHCLRVCIADRTTRERSSGMPPGTPNKDQMCVSR